MIVDGAVERGAGAERGGLVGRLTGDSGRRQGGGAGGLRREIEGQRLGKCRRGEPAGEAGGVERQGGIEFQFGPVESARGKGARRDGEGREGCGLHRRSDAGQGGDVVAQFNLRAPEGEAEMAADAGRGITGEGAEGERGRLGRIDEEHAAAGPGAVGGADDLGRGRGVVVRGEIEGKRGKAAAGHSVGAVGERAVQRGLGAEHAAEQEARGAAAGDERRSATARQGQRGSRGRVGLKDKGPVRVGDGGGGGLQEVLGFRDAIERLGRQRGRASEQSQRKDQADRFHGTDGLVPGRTAGPAKQAERAGGVRRGGWRIVVFGAIGRPDRNSRPEPEKRPQSRPTAGRARGINWQKQCEFWRRAGRAGARCPGALTARRRLRRWPRRWWHRNRRPGRCSCRGRG